MSAEDTRMAASKPLREDESSVVCGECRTATSSSRLEENLFVCLACGHHHRMNARARVAMVCDPGTFHETHTHITTTDPLAFRVGEQRYTDRVKRAQQESGLNEALLTGLAEIEGMPVAIGVMDSRFIMASMGSALGEKLCLLAEDAIGGGIPLLIFAASGGARMQEGTVALMQMAKTAAAIDAVQEAGCLYISILTDPTSGGVLASFASLGDLVLAEPRAYIGFAGTRLIEGALKVELPEGFQRAEYQLANGFIDAIVPRPEMRHYLGRVLRYLAPSGAVGKQT